MNNIEAYRLLFTDSLISSLILPLNEPFIFKAMLYFNTYNHFLMLVTATMGSCIGGVINWCLGRLMVYIRLKYNKTNKIFNYYKSVIICLIIFLAWVPIFGSLITVVSGRLKLNLYYLIPSLLISYASYFLYLIFYTI
ncbi:DedA family protein [Candidatus Mesenet endosymbiont of Phosphuga atrata]|uniref:DedA family protein n=1 Tax=Candidatus Mesenet endosymbiont of Phosphuga atrata TaxID=3066221 RepID=UPI0030D227C0